MKVLRIRFKNGALDEWRLDDDEAENAYTEFARALHGDKVPDHVVVGVGGRGPTWHFVTTAHAMGTYLVGDINSVSLADLMPAPQTRVMPVEMNPAPGGFAKVER